MGGALLFAALAVGAPALKDKGPAGLIGEWAPESGTVDGSAGPPQGPPTRWVFGADGTWEIRREGRRVFGGTYTADPAADPPALNGSRQMEKCIAGRRGQVTIGAGLGVIGRST